MIYKRLNINNSIIFVLLILNMQRGKDSVRILKPNELVNGELSIKGLCILLVHASWCGYCIKFMPDYHKVSDKAKNANLETIFCKLESNEQSKNAISAFNRAHPEYEITGFPTVLLFKHGKPISVYKGSRDPESFFKFVKSLR